MARPSYSKVYGVLLALACVLLPIVAGFKTYSEWPKPSLVLLPIADQCVWAQGPPRDGKAITQFGIRFQAANMSNGAIRLSEIVLRRDPAAGGGHGFSVAAGHHHSPALREQTMKTIAIAFFALSLLIGATSEANAFACAAGAYRAGCVGPRGAVGVRRGYGGYGYHRGYGHRPYGGAVVRPYGRACFWRAGGRICR